MHQEQKEPFITSFISKKGKEYIFRYPRIQDIDEMTTYINNLSQENTFITFSGETITREEEEKYLETVIRDIAAGNFVKILCFDKDKLIGVADVRRDTRGKARSRHIGILGITVAKEYRNEGIGKELMKLVLDEAQKQITNLRGVLLHVYSPNIAAQKLYTKMGFKEIGRIPHGIFFRGDYVDEILMHKKM